MARVTSLRDLRLDRIATPVQTNRWVEALRGYFFFQVWEAANRSGGTIPTLDEYTVARVQSGAVKATMVLSTSPRVTNFLPRRLPHRDGVHGDRLGQRHRLPF
ncbi:hypothetical protein [Streptomyces sp. NPDC086010]|uniref:terpene synthase family protein n=1 Tax=Streptomyces sp. NPDC086010 TaxID=3365745 RepID=UPI0037D17613